MQINGLNKKIIETKNDEPIKNSDDLRTRLIATTKTKWTVIIIFVMLLFTSVACFFMLDTPPSFNYRVSVSNDKTQSLNVNMTVSMPLFSKKDLVFIYLGEKDITVRSCTDSWGKTKETFLMDGIISIPVSRGSTTNITYDVAISVSAKHGNRGIIADNYAVFDGDQAFLLPAEFYVYDEEGVKNSAKKIEFEFDFPDSWREIVPFKQIKNPQWIDIYDITKNAFVFGEFYDMSSSTTGLNVYALPGRLPEDASGFEDLFEYYTDLFGSKPSLYNIVLLPSDSPHGKIMGGAGSSIVAASFDYTLLRDWQLLSHRMFHAFYDTAAPYTNVHVAPNIWLNEGLATYYENMATDVLPEPLKSNLGVDINRQMALTFDQYLYMRLKEPFTYNFAPMDENQITSDAMTEFLHYTAAPIIVKAFENKSVNIGNAPNALLQYCLNENAFENRYTALDAAIDLLGSEAQEFCENYLIGVDVPPLWELKTYQPSSTEILASLNYIETLLASWQQLENIDYPIDIISEDQLKQAMNAIDEHDVSLLSPETEADIKEYCPELYAIVKDYYWRATQKGLELNDRDLRFKMLQ